MCSKVLLLLAALAVPTTAAAAGPPQCAPPERRLDRKLAKQLDPIVDDAVTKGFAGGVALMRDGVLVYERVAGRSDSESQVPVTPETLFHVASVTKYLTAVAVLAAVDEGKIGLDAALGDVLPGTKIAARGVTPLDLLAHRSGLGSSYVAESETEAAAALAALAAQEIDAEKAGSFRYSNDGYDLLAIVLERLYGRPYEEIVREKVFSRACLERPRIWSEVDLTDPRRVGQPLRSYAPELRRRNYGMLGAAGLLISAVDLARFEHAVAGGALLSPRLLAELATPRGEVSIGKAALGSFLLEHSELGRVRSARGYEDWGDNAILNHYLDRGLILAIVTSKGPPESSGQEPFRTRISREIETVLAESR